MVWVVFSEPYRWVPPQRKSVTLKHQPGIAINVTRDCARAAIRAGKAEKAEKVNGNTGK
ncbi:MULTISPECIES: hypothetical protein [unclassified Martelella]|uniref:hypothetical protein n=1 Tax=unclassified Martelella TaxID=2629616 RepID=UPI0025BE5386|nr:hypothetical protein [Martelella sp.]